MAKPPPSTPDAQPSKTGPRRLGRVLDRILDAYAQTKAGTPADRALKQVFGRARDLGSRERAEVGDALFGVLRAERRLEDRLKRAAKAERRDLSMVDTPVIQRLMILAWLADQGASVADLEATDRFGARRIPKLFDRIVQGRLPPVKKRSPLEQLAIDLSLPTWLVERLVNAFGEERTTALGQALDGRAPVTLRVDPSRRSRDEALALIREMVPEAAPTQLSPLGITLPRAVDLPRWPLYAEGAVDLQDEGSQLIALACGVQPGQAVLDACAGAGGKSLTLWGLMGGEGRLTALDPDAHKLGELRRRAARVDARIDAHKGGLETLPDSFRERFDLVLVDAPCTGTGTLRRAPDLANRLKDADVPKEAARQRTLAAQAVAALKPGGRLVYATCSLLREENEDIVAYLLAEEPRLVAEPLADVWGEDLSARLAATHEARIGPGPDNRGPDGFYVATMRRR